MSKQTKNLIIDLLCPIGFIAFGIYLLISSSSFRDIDRIFPNLTGWCTVVISSFLLIYEIRHPEQHEKNAFEGVNFVGILLEVLMWVVYIYLFKKIGFFFDTLILCAFTIFNMGYRKMLTLFLASVGISGFVFVVFRLLMHVSLPTLLM